MQFQARYVIQMLKPMHTATKDWREAGDKRRRGGKEQRRRGGKEERRRGGEEERRRGGEEEMRRQGGEEGRLAAMHTGFKGYHECVVAIYTGF